MSDSVRAALLREAAAVKTTGQGTVNKQNQKLAPENIHFGALKSFTPAKRHGTGMYVGVGEWGLHSSN